MPFPRPPLGPGKIRLRLNSFFCMTSPVRQQKNDPVEGRFHRVASPVSRRYRRIRRPRRRSSTSNSVLYRQFRRLLELVAEAREAGVDIGNHDLLDFARYDSLLKICALPQRLGELSGRLI